MVNRLVEAIVIGSGAAGLATAVQLRRRGVEDILILTERLTGGTSINTGSDKQTYYKLSLSGGDADSPRRMAEDLFAGGGMRGDIALIEASASAQAFLNLVELGVDFPRDRFGQFVGYRTDHSTVRRATSVGPYTSRDMCLRLIDEVKRLGVRIEEDRTVVELATVPNSDPGMPERTTRVCGAVAVDSDGGFHTYQANAVVFAVGGPGGLYQASVYPAVHIGAIGLAFLAGARARNLPDSQFGLASVDVRWNVSGSYMQVIPRLFSAEPDGTGEREFLLDAFESPSAAQSALFRKGYEWPFDARKAATGSSLIDLLVYRETVERGRKVFLDYTRTPSDFSVDNLDADAREYLFRSGSTGDTPFKRLEVMNPAAISLYRDHKLDIGTQPLRIAVCAQHNNGGLAADIDWESETVAGLYPVGEVNGSHGVARPGGSALNAGQVGAIRAADAIAQRRDDRPFDANAAESSVRSALERVEQYASACRTAKKTWLDERRELRERMTNAASILRSEMILRSAVADARTQWARLSTTGCAFDSSRALVESLTNRHLCFAHLVYLESVLYSVESGVGSRGSSLVVPDDSHQADGVGKAFIPEDSSFRSKILLTAPRLISSNAAGQRGIEDSATVSQWTDCPPIPVTDDWFETVWAEYRRRRSTKRNG